MHFYLLMNRIVNFLKKWMESCWFDFHKEPKMLANLSTFIFAIQEIPRIKNLAAQIETTQKKLVCFQKKKKK